MGEQIEICWYYYYNILRIIIILYTPCGWIIDLAYLKTVTVRRAGSLQVGPGRVSISIIITQQQAAVLIVAVVQTEYYGSSSTSAQQYY